MRTKELSIVKLLDDKPKAYAFICLNQDDSINQVGEGGMVEQMGLWAVREMELKRAMIKTRKEEN